MKTSNINKTLLLIILVVLVAGVFSWYIWDHAYVLEGEIINLEGWSKPEITTMHINRAFDRAFKEIILLDIFIFTSTFLILYSLKKNNNEKNN